MLIRFVILFLMKICVSNREYCQQKTQKGGHSSDVLFWSNTPRSFFRLLRRFLKVDKFQFCEKKGALYCQKNEFINANMDALTVLSIWDTDKDVIMSLTISILNLNSVLVSF